jgi:hypothetical protein
VLIANQAMQEMLHPVDLPSLNHGDIPPQFFEVVNEGWVIDSIGAVLLRALLDSYSGQQAAPSDITGYEARVNGRGIPDLDLPEKHPQRTSNLIRRAYSYAHAALSKLDNLSDPPKVTAFISISKTWTEDPIVVGNVTFWSHHEGEKPYFSISNNDPETGLLSLDSTGGI